MRDEQRDLANFNAVTAEFLWIAVKRMSVDGHRVTDAVPKPFGRCGADSGTRRLPDERNETVPTINIFDGVIGRSVRAPF
jgi:hypothetical protein